MSLRGWCSRCELFKIATQLIMKYANTKIGKFRMYLFVEFQQLDQNLMDRILVLTLLSLGLPPPPSVAFASPLPRARAHLHYGGRGDQLVSGLSSWRARKAQLEIGLQFIWASSCLVCWRIEPNTSCTQLACVWLIDNPGHKLSNVIVRLSND